MTTEPPPPVRWQALLVGVASNAHSDDPGFAQSLNSQAEFAGALERNLPGLHEDDLIVLPEPRYPYEVTAAIALLNEAHDGDAEAGLVPFGLLFYYCGHGMDAGRRLYLSTVETVDDDHHRRRTGLALRDVLETIGATTLMRPRVLLILDCCFAGLAVRDLGGLPGKAAKRVRLLMAVGPNAQATHDPSSTGPTYFTGALVELMRDGDPEAGPWIDLQTAHRWLKPRLIARYGDARKPYLRPAGDSGAIVLGPNGAYSRGPRPPRPAPEP